MEMPSSLRRWSRRRAGVGQDLDAVLAIDWSDGADFGSMLWKLGPHGTLDIDGEPVYHQHAPVETAPISPDKVTFAEEGQAAMYRELAIVESAFANEPAFAGVAIHHLGSYLQLGS